MLVETAAPARRLIALQRESAMFGRCEPGKPDMPTYKAPVDDVKFLLNDVFHIERHANLPGFSDAARSRRRQGGLQARSRWQRDHADRLQGRVQADRRWRLDRHLGAA